MTKPLTRRQQFLLDYLVALNDEYEARDYSQFGDDAELVRRADIAFMERVGHCFRTNTDIWES